MDIYSFFHGNLPFWISINPESLSDSTADILRGAHTKKGTRSTLLYRVRGTRKPTRRQSMERAPKKQYHTTGRRV